MSEEQRQQEERLGRLPCSEIVELMTDYIEGAMPADLRARFELHLANCPPCAEYLEQMRKVIAIAGRQPGHEIPEPALGALQEAFRDWPPGPAPPGEP